MTDGPPSTPVIAIVLLLYTVVVPVVSVAENFVCPQGFPPPSVQDPGDDVSKVHPAHLRYAAAIGDSITAGFAAETLPLEFRGLSFSGGVGSPTHHTLPWLLTHYHAIKGGSVGFHLPVVPSSEDPYCYSQNDNFNVAVSGSESSFYPIELARLKNQTQTLQDDGGWMALTIFMGENDLCDNIKSCGTPEEQQSVVSQFQTNMEKLLSDLIGWRKRLYINLVQLAWIRSVANQESFSWRCETEEKKLIHACRCMRRGNVTDSLAKLDSTNDSMNAVLEAIADNYDRIRPDVGVNLVRTFNREPIPDLSYLSGLDCFHPSAKTHHLMAHALWNSMLKPSQPTPMTNASALVPLCANATSRLMTWKDQKRENDGMIKGRAIRGRS